MTIERKHTGARTSQTVIHGEDPLRRWPGKSTAR